MNKSLADIMAKCCVVFSQPPFEDLTVFRVRHALLLVSVLTSNAPGEWIQEAWWPNELHCKRNVRPSIRAFAGRNWNDPIELCLRGPYHWGSSHEGSGRHPRQHGGGRGRRFGKFMANSHRVYSLLRPSFCELIVNVMGHIDAESRAAVIRHLAAIPA